MFANATHVGFAQRVVATLVACAVVLWSLGAWTTAQAANLTNVSNTLSDSDLSVTSAHTIAFTIPAGSTYDAADDFTITLPTGAGEFSIDPGFAIGDVSATVAGSAVSVDNFSETGGEITLSLDTSAAATEEIVVAIADGEITNPSTAGSYEIEIATVADSGKTRVAIIDNVLVTAIVETTFDFTIAGLATSTAINGTSTTGSTTATEIPFGVLTAGEIKTLAQRLNVTTNAINGFVVTVEQDDDLNSATGADIDGFTDVTYVDNPTSWADPSNSISDENTWGHWGLTTEDGNLQGAGTDFASADTWVAASTTPRTVFAHNGPSDGATAGGSGDSTSDDIGQTEVGYQIEITPLQEAADDYNTTLTYIATPTF